MTKDQEQRSKSGHTGGSGVSEALQRHALPVLALGFAGLCAALLALVHADRAAGREILALLHDPMLHLAVLGKALVVHHSRVTTLTAVVFLVLAAWAAAGHVAPPRRASRAILAGLGLCLVGQGAVVVGRTAPGTLLWLAGAALALAGLTGLRRAAPPSWRRLTPRVEPLLAREVVLLLGLLLVAAAFRFFMLDQVPNRFEGELAPYYAAATDLWGMWWADAGWHGPWAPLHLSFYLPVWLTTRVLGTNVLAIRSAAALVGLLSVPLLWALARRTGGRTAALVATAFFVLDPLQVGWSRSDVHPHASTLWAPLLVCLALLHALDRRRRRDFALLAVAMGLSWYTYPSGASAVAIPVVYLVGLALCRRRELRRLGLRFPAGVAAGVVLWLAQLPLPWLLVERRWYVPDLVHQFGARTAWDADVGMSFSDTTQKIVTLAWSNTLHLLEGLVSRVPEITHQTFLPLVNWTSPRTLVWWALPLALLGLGAAAVLPTLRRARVVVAWALVAAVPAILSSHGFPKRAATLYPALLVLAGLGFAVAWSRLPRTRRWLRGAVILTAVAGFSGLSAATAFLWFSGAVYTPAHPAMETSMEALKSRIRPGTILVMDGSHPYTPGMTTFLLLDVLADPTRQPVAWIPVYEEKASFPALLEDPVRGVDTISNTPWYMWTRLRRLVPRLQATRCWKRVVFLFQTEVHDEAQERVFDDLARVLACHPEATVDVLPGPNSDYTFTVVEYPLPPCGEQTGADSGMPTPPTD